MKKFTLFLILMVGIFNPSKINAVSYRGFLEGIGSYITNNSANYANSKFQITGFVTNGIQFHRNFYAGVSLGYNYGQELGSNDHVLKAGLDIRYDGFGLFGSGKRISPFVDLKGGINCPFSAYSEGKKPGMFLTPSIGIRLGLSSKVGLNISISYSIINSIKYKDFEYWEEGDGRNNYGVDYKIYTGTLNSYQLGLGFGVDF